MSWSATANYEDGALNITAATPPVDEMAEDVREVFDRMLTLAEDVILDTLDLTNATVTLSGHVQQGETDPSSLYLQITGRLTERVNDEDERGQVQGTEGDVILEEADVAPHDRQPRVKDEAEAEGEESADDTDEDATEPAERKAEELGVDLADVTGTGEGGRILVSDVEAYAEEHDD